MVVTIFTPQGGQLGDETAASGFGYSDNNTFPAGITADADKIGTE